MTASRSAANDAPPKVVLVVDDDPAGARHIAQTVQELGYRSVVANSWTDAIRRFGTGEVDLVLMDAVMPTVDGFKLTKILRARARCYVPIVFVTGLADAGAREQGIAVGADDFLTKPVDDLELKVRLTAMLRIRQLTRDLEVKTQALARLANIDALTGIANRRSFEAQLPVELSRANRYQRPLSVLMLDIDHFKRINDAHGHAAGDHVLAGFGRLLADLTRTCDLAYRYGGEEFVVLAPETNSKEALHLGERIRVAFERRSRGEDSGPHTVSIGVSGTDLFDESVSTADLISTADTALYRAKALGRNCVRRYDPRGESRAA